MKTQSYIILSTLKNAGIGTLKLISTILEDGFQSRKRTMRLLWEGTDGKQKKNHRDEMRENIRHYYQCLRGLEERGLIIKQIEKKKKYIGITKKGIEELEKIRLHGSRLSTKHYEKIKSDYKIIVIFDIPEELKQKRDWLREVLKNLRFKMVQRSVWMGKTKIPKKFIDDLRDMKILNYIDFLEVKSFKNEIE